MLSFGFYFAKGGVKIRIAPKAFTRMKEKIRALTSRKWSVSMGYRIHKLNLYIRGWMGYFRLSQTPKKVSDLDTWFRRRMRQIRWKEWKNPRTRVVNLRRLGIARDKANEWGMTSRAYWRIAKSPILHRALPTSTGKILAYYSFAMRGRSFKRPSEPPDAGPHVRWCERRELNTPAYSIRFQQYR